MSSRSLPSRITSAYGLFGLLTLTPILASAQDEIVPDEASRQFYADQVFPILQEHCFKCHGGEEKLKGNFRITSREGLLRGGDLGSGLDEENPAQSLVLEMVNYGNEDYQMPPKAKLPDAEIEILTRWVVEHDAAFDPDLEIKGSADESRRGFTISDEDRRWWSYQPVKRPEIPPVSRPDWIVNEIDAFVLKGLDEAGLKPNPEAEPGALCRRVHYDLIGLPPKLDEVEAFEAAWVEDPAKAWEGLIDDLLARPQYGEKWARHWLDIVRYAESNGFERDNPKPEIWRYRDYVIDAFNQDKPYDQFIIEQLAGDEIDEPTLASLAATGFHRLMQWDDEPADRKQHVYDVLADNVQITSEAFLGTTMGCARCHDHKADPISQKDYYSFMSFFHGVTHYQTQGTITFWASTKEREKFKIEQDKKFDAAKAKLDGIGEKLRAFYEDEGVLARKGEVNAVTFIDSVRGKGATWEYTLQKPTTDWKEVGFRNKSWLKSPGGFGNGNPPNSVIKTQWNSSEIWARSSFGLKDLPTSLTLEIYHDEDVEVYLNGVEVFRATGYVTDYKTVTLGKDAVDALQTGRNTIAVHCKQTGGGQFLDLALRNAPGGKHDDLPLVEIVRRNQGQSMKQKVKQRLGEDLITQYMNLTREIQSISKAQAGIALNVVKESGPNPEPMQVHLRGSAHAPGDQVVPAFLSVLGDSSEPTPAKFTPVQSEIAHTSGRRLALAEWIASPDNPLTTRVIMNRMWQHHFGRGIAPSTNDLGRLGEAPTHPELLDWLAAELVERGWSLKEMHRLILKSQTYRMSSAPNEANLAVDPGNRHFWRFNMRRLTAEELRDTILAISGQLNLEAGGPSVFPPLPPEVLATASRPGKGWPISNNEADHYRRSVYIHVKRSLRHQFLADFDQADTDSPCAVRFATTVPTQALAMLNSGFVNRQAEVLAEKLRREHNAPEAQVRAGLERAFQRAATDDEIRQCLNFMESLKSEAGLDDKAALDRFALLALNLNELIYLD